VLDPEAFGGLGAFKRQMDAVASAARAATPRPGVDRVRLPGERGLAHRRDALAHGVPLYPKILPALEEWSKEYGVAMPTATAHS
jgi:L-lactate dehydrogenase